MLYHAGFVSCPAVRFDGPPEYDTGIRHLIVPKEARFMDDVFLVGMCQSYSRRRHLMENVPSPAV